MKRQTLIALGVALILGLVAVIVANAYLSGREKQLENSPKGLVRVAVAAMPLDFGTELTAEKVKFVNYPATALPPGTYRTMQELLPGGKSRAALRPIQINQPLLASDLTGEGEGASIAALLPDGMRAVTIRINDVSGVAGFVNPNDVVDVLITRQNLYANGSSGENVTDVLLQNVRILAKGQSVKDNNEKAQVTRSVTVEATPIDAQKLVLGQQLGSLSLVLRKPGFEQNIPQVKPITLQDLRYSYQTSLPPQVSGQAAAAGAPPPEEQRARVARISQPRRPAPSPVRRAPPTAAPAKSTNTVVVTRGTEASSYEVGDYARQ